jgi:hypothetical protein
MFSASALEGQDHPRDNNDDRYCRQAVLVFRTARLRFAPTDYVPNHSFLARYRHGTTGGFAAKRLAGAAGFPSLLSDLFGIFYY